MGDQFRNFVSEKRIQLTFVAGVAGVASPRWALEALAAQTSDSERFLSH
jgi:hypothetical protein